MTQKELIKEGVKLAEEELKDEEKKQIKVVVKTILETLRLKEEQRQKLDEEIKILKRDLDDMKDGRIDRIKERQDIDPKAKEASVIIIKEKIIEKHIPTPWYIPWIIEVKPQYTPYIPIVWNSSSSTCLSINGTTTCNTSIPNTITVGELTTNNSMVHMYTSGTYKLNDGTIKYL